MVKFHSANHSANVACVRENILNIVWEACLCTHVFMYEFVPLENSHSKDELQLSLQ